MITFVNSMEEANCITHSGTMHADDVFATAFLELYLKNIKLFRTNLVNKEKLNKETIVYDIGREKFDHHQIGALKRENGITYCSFGLLWKEYGKKFLNDRKIQYLDDVFIGIDLDLIEGIDADDNGVFPKIDANYKVKTLSNVIKLFNPSYNSSENENDQFLRAVNVAKSILEEEISYITGKVIAFKKMQKIIDNLDDKKYLILDEYVPYEEAILNNQKANNLLFVVFPSNRGGYAIKTLPKSIEDKTSRMEMPLEWAGLSGENLENVSLIKGLNFCHLGRFLVNCETLEAVYKVLEYLCQE